MQLGVGLEGWRGGGDSKTGGWNTAKGEAASESSEEGRGGQCVYTGQH